MGFKFEILDENAPGYLKRERKRLEFLEVSAHIDSDSECLIKSQDAMIEWLLDYITVPEDRNEAREALMNASQKEYDQLRKAISKQGKPSPKAQENSGGG